MKLMKLPSLTWILFRFFFRGMRKKVKRQSRCCSGRFFLHKLFVTVNTSLSVETWFSHVAPAALIKHNERQKKATVNLKQTWSKTKEGSEWAWSSMHAFIHIFLYLFLRFDSLFVRKQVKSHVHSEKVDLVNSTSLENCPDMYGCKGKERDQNRYVRNTGTVSLCVSADCWASLNACLAGGDRSVLRAAAGEMQAAWF